MFKQEATMKSRTKKQSSDRLSKLAGQILAGKTPTTAEIRALAASVLGQDEKRGKRS